MSSVPVYEAKTRLSELLVQVQDGEEITITKRGVAVARLVPAQSTSLPREGDSQRSRVEATFAALAALRLNVTLDLPLQQAIQQGRD